MSAAARARRLLLLAVVPITLVDETFSENGAQLEQQPQAHSLSAVTARVPAQTSSTRRGHDDRFDRDASHHARRRLPLKSGR